MIGYLKMIYLSQSISAYSVHFNSVNQVQIDFKIYTLFNV